MYGEIHILTGIIMQQAGGDGWGILPSAGASLLSHIAIDDLNVGTYRIYHQLGTSWRRYAAIGCRIALDATLVWWLWHHPANIACGLLAWAPDIDHILPWKYKHWLHQHMWPKVLQTEAGMIATLVAMIVLMGVVMT